VYGGVLAMGFGLLCSPALYICNLYTMKKSVKKHLLTRAEALSGALPPRFRGAHMISVQTASRAVNEVVDGRGAVVFHVVALVLKFF
jgi:hypothetical protein